MCAVWRPAFGDPGLDPVFLHLHRFQISGSRNFSEHFSHILIFVDS